MYFAYEKNMNGTVETESYRQNVCVPPKLFKPNPDCDGVWRWGLWEVIGPAGWHPDEWSHCLDKRNPRELPCPFCHMVKQWENGCVWPGKQALTKHWIMDFPASRPWEICVVYKSSLWYSVIAAFLKKLKWIKFQVMWNSLDW